MQLSEFREEVRNNLGEDTEDFWKTTQIDRAINRAIRYFCHEEPWAWLQTTSTAQLLVDQNTIVLPDDVDIVRAFNIVLQKGSERPRPAKRVSPIEGIRYGITRTDAGQPRVFYLQSTVTSVGGALQYTIKFVPKADGTYSIDLHYLRRPVKLVETTDEPDIPEDYQDGVLAFATATLWLPELQGSGVKAQEQMEIYNAMLINARRDQGRFAEDETVIFGGHVEEGEFEWALPRLPDQYGPHFPWGEL